ncbi:hypothetical protein [Nonomuraea sp. NPDC048826]|uniref:hypothetical protein n=1 Tax=Nonomuraea sp. NPDC048826 TaxID=3364347 RepID=UPI00371BE95E
MKIPETPYAPQDDGRGRADRHAQAVADVMVTEIVSVTAALGLMAMLSRPGDEPR